jgi:pre-mRNA-splicing factor ISY1
VLAHASACQRRPDAWHSFPVPTTLCTLPTNAPPAAHPPYLPQAILEWEQKEQERSAAAASVAGGAVQVLTGDEDAPEFVAYVPLPDQKDIELRILEKKKRDLLAKYTSDSLLQEQESAKAMLNKR